MTKGRIAVALGSLYFAKSGEDNPRFRAARKAVGQDARGAPRAAGREPGLRGPAWTVTYVTGIHPMPVAPRPGLEPGTCGL